MNIVSKMFDSGVFTKESDWTGGILIGILMPELRQSHRGQTETTDPSGYSVRQTTSGQ
jgi:hypothetical protein